MADDKKKLDIVKKYYVRKENGEIDYEHPYDFIEETNIKGIYFVELDGHIGYMDENGRFIVLPVEYESSRTNYQGYHYRNNNNGWNCYDGDNAITTVYKRNFVGAINNRGEKIIPCEFEEVATYSSKVSKRFVPVAIKSNDSKKLLWGMYDIKKKRISVNPQYEDIEKEWNGYASFKQNDKWGLLHCATGKVVAPAKYLISFNVYSDGLARAFLGGTYDGRYVDPEECHVLLVDGANKAKVILSGYDWIERTGPSVMKCRMGSSYKPKQEDSFKIVKLPKYIAMVKNAVYEAGYFLKDGGFVPKWSNECTSYEKMLHAKYVSGGIITAKTYDGVELPVTYEIMQEVIKSISKE